MLLKWRFCPSVPGDGFKEAGGGAGGSRPGATWTRTAPRCAGRGAMDEDAAPADADADAPPPVPGGATAPRSGREEAAAAPPPAPETPRQRQRPWETLPTLDNETLESADKEQIKYDIAVLEEERDRLC